MSERRHTRHQRGSRWGSLALFWSLATVPAFALDLATTPQSVPTPLAPNVILTIDDSHTMAHAYALDRGNSLNATRYDFSSHYNPLYYDPSLNYPPRPAIRTSTSPGPV